MAPETIRPDPIALIRQRVEVCRRENYPYDSLETAYRDRLDLLVCVETEQTMHAAWRKRAEEAEAEVGRLRAAGLLVGEDTPTPSRRSARSGDNYRKPWP